MLSIGNGVISDADQLGFAARRRFCSLSSIASVRSKLAVKLNVSVAPFPRPDQAAMALDGPMDWRFVDRNAADIFDKPEDGAETYG
jgi:hypothetical protein